MKRWFPLLALLTASAVAQESAGLDEHGDDPSTATHLNLGERAKGIVDGNDEDYFRLDLPRKTTVAFSGTGSGATTLLRMDGEHETCLASHFQGQGTTRRELAQGAYFLRVTGFGQGESYDLLVHEAAPDDHGDMPETATELPLGASVSGEIDQAGDIDFFRLELSKRTALEIVGQGLELALPIRICDPEQRDLDFALAGGDGAGESAWFRRELETGIYYLAVRSNFGQGPYEIGVRETALDDHGDSPASATHLALGQLATGSIDPRGDFDYYRFDLPRQMHVTLSAGADAGVNFRLVDADGRDATDVNGVYPYTERLGQGALRLRRELDAGRHYLRVWVRPPAGGRIRNYEILLRETSPDDHGNMESEATAIVVGGTAAGEIESHGDVDFFRLDLERRTAVVVAMTGIAEFGPLTDAGGNVLSAPEWIPEHSEHQLRGDLDPGTYHIEVAAYRRTGRYDIVAREAEPDDHGDRPDTATAIAPGGMAEGTIDRWSDVDYYRLDLGRPSVLAVSVTSDFDNIELTLFDAEGALLQEGYGLSRTDLRTRAELEPGTYYVSVASYMSVNSYASTYMGSCPLPERNRYTGRYRLSVWEVPPDDHGGVPETASDLQPYADAAGDIGFMEGDIDPREDRDVFRLELARPTDLVVDVIGSFWPLARILNAEGEETGPEPEAQDAGLILEEVIVLTEVCDDRTMKVVPPDSEEGELQKRFEVQPGVYYLELRSESGAGWYRIDIR